MKRIIFITLLMAFCSFDSLAQKNETGLTDKEYVVLSAILSDSAVIANRTIPAKILKKTEKDVEFDNNVSITLLKKVMPNLLDETVSDFNLKNEKEYVLEKKFSINDKYM